MRSADDECPIEDPRLSPAKLAQIEAAAQTFASDDEIAAHVGISEEQLHEYYRKVVDRGAVLGRLWLRQRMFDLANGDAKAGRAPDPEAQKLLARMYLLQEG